MIWNDCTCQCEPGVTDGLTDDVSLNLNLSAEHHNICLKIFDWIYLNNFLLIVEKMLRLKHIAVASKRVNLCASSIRYKSVEVAAEPSNDGEEKIVIPKRIDRGPTDVLMALSRTVGRDPTAPLYKYHDDPYLVPYSKNEKKMFALAYESGRKTAQWVKKEHADILQVFDELLNCLFRTTCSSIP